MKIKTTFAALILTVMPGLAFAQGCHGGTMHENTTAMSCAEGSMIDPETGTCVPLVTG
ncbi:hypothetical protein AB3Y40_05820 [Yoonia sp. R2331]|uniref:hypothetical protein n=1 Tax=Yoonia sp. R2331 TaxID=3237238 RepID=UPI0034E56403